MAKQQKQLAIIYSDTAKRELHQIWCWTYSTFSERQADRYENQIRSFIRSISQSSRSGTVFDSKRAIYYRCMKQKSNRYGHVIVYQIREESFQVLHIFHSAQNWQDELLDELP